MEFSERLKQARGASRMTQRAVAEALGVSVQAVSQWENGQVTIQPDRLAKLSALLEVDLEWLRDGNEDKARPTREFMASKDLYNNQPLNVITLTSLHRTFIAHSIGHKLELNQNSRVIYVEDGLYISPVPILIENDSLSPRINKGDIAIFDFGCPVEDDDVAIALISENGFFRLNQFKDRAIELHAAIIIFGDEVDGSPRSMVVDANGARARDQPRSAYAVLGPMVERRSFAKKSSGSA